jgi:TonB family protein
MPISFLQQRPVGPAASARTRVAATTAISIVVHLSLALAFSASSGRGTDGLSSFRPALTATLAGTAQPAPTIASNRHEAIRLPATLNQIQAPTFEPEAFPLPPVAPVQITGDAIRRPDARAHTPHELPAAPEYRLPSGLESPAQLIDMADPEYPVDAGTQSGTVVLRILINESGGVDNVAPVRAMPPNVFDRAAVAAFSSAKFRPGRFAGLPVKSQLVVEMEFTPVNRGANVAGRSY